MKYADNVNSMSLKLQQLNKRTNCLHSHLKFVTDAAQTFALLFKGFVQLSDLCQAGLRREVLVVDLPQQPPLVVLVHLFGAGEQQGPSAVLRAPSNLRFLTARTCALDPHLCGKTVQLD